MALDQQQPQQVHVVDANELQQPHRFSKYRFTVTFSSCLFLIAVGTIALIAQKRSSSPSAHEHEDIETEHGPAEVLLRQLRQLDRTVTSEADLTKELALRTSLGHIYRDQGRYEKAVQTYTLAHDTALRLGGGGHLIEVLQSRGTTRVHQGRLVAARQDLEMAYVLVDKQNAPERSIDVLHALGDVQRDQGKLNDALEMYEKAMKQAKELLAADLLGPKVAALTSDIAEVHARKGDNARALSSFRQALKQLEDIDRDPMRVAAVPDPQLAQTRSLLGNALQASGDTAHAMEAYRKALRQQTKHLGPVHPDLIFTRLNIARAHRDLGEHDKALEAIEAVEKTLRSGPMEGPDLSRTLVVKTDLLREVQRYGEATDAIAEALEHQGKCFKGEVSPEVAVALISYGSLLHDQRKFKDALRNYNRALELNMQTLGPTHPETAASHNNIGTLYQDVGDDLEAQKHFEISLDIQSKSQGAISMDMATTYNNLGTILYKRGELEDAARLLAKAIEVLDELGAPEGSPDRAVYRENLDEVVQKIHEKSTTAQADTQKREPTTHEAPVV
eukprot:gnl/TRDRNA2_/TRDRNA2_179378_c0_seq1.p1 gnl/TRDRNA2_/TRDRNA2_179378_c0~~gnl/TRDRNA2_/TRDRNA2_179378_c0_seq1.p1  ORF type:complete len:560 (-),score=151.94 gnl/TRDRNA2_/TRDRNA2_179378_c0_seq1:347-2026(-)